MTISYDEVYAGNDGMATTVAAGAMMAVVMAAATDVAMHTDHGQTQTLTQSCVPWPLIL